MKNKLSTVLVRIFIAGDLENERTVSLRSHQTLRNLVADAARRIRANAEMRVEITADDLCGTAGRVDTLVMRDSEAWLKYNGGKLLSPLDLLTRLNYECQSDHAHRELNRGRI
jgi:hypothetical protein